MLPNFKSGFGGSKSAAVRMGDIKAQEVERITSHCKELDRALGGGFIPGQTIILGGDPGIGKSTLSMQTAATLSQNGKVVLYVAGEENLSQLKARADRLKADASAIIVLVETIVEVILRNAKQFNPDIIFIDSIQTTYSNLSRGVPGQTNQLKVVTQALTHFAKERNIPIILIGHVTKAGGLAGPKVLEHMVDTVLYFEGEEGMPLRTLRAVKNRFGNIQDVGIFEMHGDGLHEVPDPSKLFLQGRDMDATGSMVCPVVDGNRCMLVEIQALVTGGMTGSRSTVIGLDRKRVKQLFTTFGNVAGVDVGGIDLSLSVAGDVTVKDTASDLAIMLSIISKYLDMNVCDVVAFGEIGLSGEIRPVSQAPQRIKESLRVGFKKIVLPAGNKEAEKLVAKELEARPDVELLYFDNISQIIRMMCEPPALDVDALSME